MGKQYNKAENQKRRKRYLKRKRLAAKAIKQVKPPAPATTEAPVASVAA